MACRSVDRSFYLSSLSFIHLGSFSVLPFLFRSFPCILFLLSRLNMSFFFTRLASLFYLQCLSQVLFLATMAASDTSSAYVTGNGIDFQL
jgi:hypothetical protein